LSQARPVATSWSFAGTLSFVGTKFLKRFTYYRGLGQGFCIKHGATFEKISRQGGTGLWILDLRGIFLIYPESSIKHPASVLLKKSDIYAAN